MIHPTAIIHRDSNIAENVSIGPYAVIGEKVKILSGTNVGAHAIIEFSEIGEDCHIHPHSFVGTPPQDMKYKGEETRLRMGRGTIVRECVTLNRGTADRGETVIGEKCLFMAYSHVAHDCVIGHQVILANSVAIAGHVDVGDGAIFGGMAGIHQFVRIGSYSMIGGGSMVPNDIPPYCLAQGDRSRLIGLNVIGLRRKRIPRDVITELKQAYQTVFLSNLPIESALEKIESSSHCSQVKELVDFLRTSERGFCRPSLKASTLVDFKETELV